MKENLLYFAYGSNMSVPRIQARIPGAEFVSVAGLREHRLTFSKPGSDDSGKCDALFTGRDDDLVYGVVYLITPQEKLILDHYEGLGVHYLVKSARVLSYNSGDLDVFLYVATEVLENLKPYSWYKRHVLHGAIEAGLPEPYRQYISDIIASEDPDPERNARETVIYESG